jgi:hypothetical protein
LLLSLLAVYLRTLAPGLTWANDGRDGGDLITAAATGGIAHPSGYPLYLLLARLFQSLPAGSLAYRTNLLSAVAMALAAVLVYQLVVDSCSKLHAWPAALAAGFAFGLAPLAWSQAVITEVYGLQALLVALVLYLYTSPRLLSISRPMQLDRWRGLALGLAMSNHVTAVLLVPAALVFGSLHRQAGAEGTHSWFQSFELHRGALLRQAGMALIGLSPYLILPLRALSNPPVNWGNPVTPERFWWLVSGQLYRSYYLQWDLPELWERLQAWAGLLTGQWGLIGLALALFGLVYFFTPSRLLLFTVWQALVYSAFAMLYGSADSYVYLLPVCISLAVWVGLGLAGILNREGLRSNLMGPAVSILFILYLFGSAAYHWPQVDASQDRRAEDFGGQVLGSAPANALVFAKGDEAVFTLWYFCFALRARPDLIVVAEDLLHFDWYQESLRSTYPSLIVPGPFPWPTTLTSSNPSRPVCYVQASGPTPMECSPPLDVP